MLSERAVQGREGGREGCTIAVDQLLLRKGEELARLERVGSLQGTSGGERPARATRGGGRGGGRGRGRGGGGLVL